MEKETEGSVNIKWLMETAERKGWCVEKNEDNTVTINGNIYNLIQDEEYYAVTLDLE